MIKRVDNQRSFLHLFRDFLEARLRRGEAYGLAFTAGLLLTVLMTGIFVWIGAGVEHATWSYPLDRQAQDVVEDIRQPGDVGVARFITNLGGSRGTLMFAIPLALLLLFARRWYALLGLLFASGLGGIVMNLLKLIFGRVRPLEPVIPAAGFSFPSGHAFAATVFFGYCIYLAWKMIHSPPLRWLIVVVCVLLALAIGFSRVYLNVHYFSDVVGGILSGVVWLVSSIFLLKAVEKRRSMTRG